MLSVDNYALDEEDELITEDTAALNGLPKLNVSGDVLGKMRALEDQMELRINYIEQQVHEMKEREET